MTLIHTILLIPPVKVFKKYRVSDLPHFNPPPPPNTQNTPPLHRIHESSHVGYSHVLYTQHNCE